MDINKFEDIRIRFGTRRREVSQRGLGEFRIILAIEFVRRLDKNRTAPDVQYSLRKENEAIRAVF